MPGFQWHPAMPCFQWHPAMPAIEIKSPPCAAAHRTRGAGRTGRPSGQGVRSNGQPSGTAIGARAKPVGNAEKLFWAGSQGASITDFVGGEKSFVPLRSSILANEHKKITPDPRGPGVADARFELLIAFGLPFKPERRARAKIAGAPPRIPGLEAFALHALAQQLARPADSFCLFTGPLFRRLFVVPAKFHFAEDSLALHLLLERAQGLIDVVVSDQNLHGIPSPLGCRCDTANRHHGDP